MIKVNSRLTIGEQKVSLEMTSPNARRFDTLRQDLHADYGHEYTAQEIDSILDATIERHEVAQP